MAFGMPLAVSRVPSMGSTATSHSGPLPSPTCSPLYSIGARSFSPSPITTTPFIDTVLISIRIACTAAPSAPFLSPRPTHRAAAIAPASVTRASSRARFRSGALRLGSAGMVTSVASSSSQGTGLAGTPVPRSVAPFSVIAETAFPGWPWPRMCVHASRASM